jgi:ATP-binding cassette subfamily B protein
VKFPHYRQLDASDCGATCLRMVAKYYGKHYNLDTLKEKCAQRNQGVNMSAIKIADIYKMRRDMETFFHFRPAN